MKRPTKKQVQFLRLALGMTGVVAISDNLSELILVVQSEMRRLGGEYSLRDGARIASELGEIHKKEMK
jgi:hypothetical protein